MKSCMVVCGERKAFSTDLLSHDHSCNILFVFVGQVWSNLHQQGGSGGKVGQLLCHLERWVGGMGNISTIIYGHNGISFQSYCYLICKQNTIHFTIPARIHLVSFPDCLSSMCIASSIYITRGKRSVLGLVGSGTETRMSNRPYSAKMKFQVSVAMTTTTPCTHWSPCR